MSQHRDVLPAGTMLDGKYRIDRLIGAGGFGMTYEAHDIGLNLRVAVKEYYPAQFGMRDGTLTVRPRSAGESDLFNRLKDSFLREARTLAQLRHVCIVRVLSVFEGHGTAYMIMEYEPGRSLKGWLEDLGRKPTQGELDRLVMPLLDALEMMHGEDFLHRDIAPDNIIVRADGSPVLLDFGAARRVMAELSGALTGVVKSGYSPQEQYANDPRAQGPWSDIYALGATLYRCVAGKAPEEATLRMLDDPTPPAAVVAAGPYRPGFLAAIDQAIRVRPRERPQSIAAFRALLDAGNPGKAAGTGGWSRIDPPASTPASGTRPRWLPAAILAGLLLLGGGGMAFYASTQRSADPWAEFRDVKEAPTHPEATPAKTADRPPVRAPGTVAARLDDVMGPCPFCDDIAKLVSPAEFAALKGLPDTIARALATTPADQTSARRFADLLRHVDLEPDPVGTIRAGDALCTSYIFGTGAPPSVGTPRRCIVRMVLIGGELTSLTLETTTGTLFHANIKKFRVNAMAALGRTFVKGHAITRYNLARPRNAEDTTYGNTVGLVISLAGTPALITPLGDDRFELTVISK